MENCRNQVIIIFHWHCQSIIHSSGIFKFNFASLSKKLCIFMHWKCLLAMNVTIRFAKATDCFVVHNWALHEFKWLKSTCVLTHTTAWEYTGRRIILLSLNHTWQLLISQFSDAIKFDIAPTNPPLIARIIVWKISLKKLEKKYSTTLKWKRSFYLKKIYRYRVSLKSADFWANMNHTIRKTALFGDL